MGQLENRELQAENDRLRAVEQDMKREIHCLKASQQVFIEGDLAGAKHRAEQAECKLTALVRVQVTNEDLTRRLQKSQEELETLRMDAARMKESLDQERALRRRLKKLV